MIRSIGIGSCSRFLALVAFSAANRCTSRIKSGTGFRRKMLHRRDIMNTKSTDRTLTITRVFDAPVDLVWRCWTEDAHLKKWSAPRGFTIPRSEGDLRVGGKWRVVMRTPEGQELGLGGVYRQIVPHKLLVMT